MRRVWSMRELLLVACGRGGRLAAIHLSESGETVTYAVFVQYVLVCQRAEERGSSRRDLMIQF